MSFSTEVKEELCGHISHATHCRAAELGAFLSMNAEMKYKEDTRMLVIKNENELCIEKIHKLLSYVFNIDTDIAVKESQSKNDIYRIVISDDDIIHGIFQTLKLSEGNGRLFCNNILVERPCCKRAFLRGAFIASGSINNPEKAYHFELVCDTAEKANQLMDIFKSFDVDAKYVVRKKYHVVYIKEGSVIVDILNIMEAHVSLMKMENVRILKDIRNSINRQVNCDAANMNKTATAAVKQIEDIRYIDSIKGLKYLPAGLREVALIRLDEPELPLKELGERLKSPIGKSGVNHRLRKISEIAENLRESNN